MKTNRRKFINTALAGGLTAPWLYACSNTKTRNNEQGNQKTDYNRLDDVLKQPVLKKELFPKPVIIESLELLHYERNFLCRVRSSDGAEGVSVSHSGMNMLYPIFTNAPTSLMR